MDPKLHRGLFLLLASSNQSNRSVSTTLEN